MYTRNIIIKNLDDAKSIVNIANKYKNLNIKISKDDYSIDAHSIIGVISMGVLNSEFSGAISLMLTEMFLRTSKKILKITL